MRRTDFSAACWKCTKMMVVAAKREVPARASLEPREAIVGRRREGGCLRGFGVQRASCYIIIFGGERSWQLRMRVAAAAANRSTDLFGPPPRAPSYKSARQAAPAGRSRITGQTPARSRKLPAGAVPRSIIALNLGLAPVGNQSVISRDPIPGPVHLGQTTSDDNSTNAHALRFFLPSHSRSRLLWNTSTWCAIISEQGPSWRSDRES